MDFTAFYGSSMLLGEISELFFAPVIPKMVIVGLTEEKDENLRLFKEILTKALDNLFVIEYCEQFIPEPLKTPSDQVAYRNHEVKETWMYKMRNEKPAILIDFRLISEYIYNEDDSMLADQLLQTKSSLPEDGPVYLVSLAGRGVSSQRTAAIAKQAKLDKSVVSVIELYDEATMITASLKQRIQECFEYSRAFYQNLGKKYKKSLVSKSTKFVQPWMPTVYYYFKLAVLEEFRGDFHSALKYYHTILAKEKELIESPGAAGGEERHQKINWLRKSADICFTRLSFLLFRLNQCGEAEFGLFRYLNYFSHGLNQNDQIMWRYNMSRGFARQLMKSSVWLKENELLMRGAAHFLIYALKIIKKYSGEEEVYQVQEMKMRDLSEALDSALKNPHLTRVVDYLQFLIIEQYFSQSLIAESGPFINYLKESQLIKGWKLIEDEILKKSIVISRSQQNYKTAVQDTWRQVNSGANNVFTSSSFEFEDWCLMHAQMFQEPIRLNFSSEDLINCQVKFHKSKCEIFEECQVELNIYVKNRCTFEFDLESIGIFFDNEQIEPLTFSSPADKSFDLRLVPGGVLNLKATFYPSKLGKIKISFVTMQLKRPFLALQFDDSAFFYQPKSDKLCSESLEFVRICEKTTRANLSLRVEARRPRINVDILVNTMVLAYTEAPISVTVTNLMEHAVTAELLHLNEKYEIKLAAKEIQILSLRHRVRDQNEKVKIKTWTRFNLELMNFKCTEICNFDVVEEEFQSNYFNPVNPFKITLKSSKIILIKARCPVEFLAVTGATESFVLEKGEKKAIKAESRFMAAEIKVSFRLLQDSSKQVYHHQYSIK